MKHIENYLQFLQEYPCSLGDETQGEIRIITAPEQIAQIESEMKQSLQQKGQPSHWAEVGIVYEDPYIWVIRDAVVFPTGKTGTYIRIVEKPNLQRSCGAVALPLINGKIALLKIYRHCTRSWEIELPRGFSQPGEDAANTAERELREETGLHAKKTIYLGKVHCNSGLIGSQANHLYFIHASEADKAQKTQAQEAIDRLLLLSPSQVMQMIREGEILDSYTICAMMMAREKGLL